MGRGAPDRREGMANTDSATKGHVRPLTDAERVQGQIERGEVRAGPEGARQIAAQHEEAYGDVWRR